MRRSLYLLLNHTARSVGSANYLSALYLTGSAVDYLKSTSLELRFQCIYSIRCKNNHKNLKNNLSKKP